MQSYPDLLRLVFSFMRDVIILQLKDFAEVARVIDEVDDEEWLLMFIGELETILSDVIKTDLFAHPVQVRKFLIPIVLNFFLHISIQLF